MNVRLKDITGMKAVLAEPSAEDLTLLADPEYAGQRVTAEDVHVREMFLCCDQYDRTFERFPKAYLDQFVLTLPGKSVLGGHDTRSMPLGRFFRADLAVKMEDYPVPVSGRQLPSWWYDDEEDAAPLPDGFKDVIPNFDTQRKKVTYLHPGYYFANDPSTEGLRKSIDTGVLKWTSIGFRYDDLDCDLCKASYFKKCPHIMGYEDKDGKLCTGTYSGDAAKAEALEGSIVYLGAQPRARLIKQLHEGAIDPVACAATEFGEDLVALKEAEAMARQFGHKRKSWFFPGLQQKASQEDLEERSPADSSFEDHIERSLADISSVIERADAIRQKRESDTDRRGNAFSEARREQFKALRDRMDRLIETTEPKSERNYADAMEMIRLTVEAEGLLA